MVLSGDRNIVGGTKLANGILEFTTNQMVSWSSEMHNGAGNVAWADGSVQYFHTNELQQAFQNTGIATNRLAIP